MLCMLRLVFKHLVRPYIGQKASDSFSQFPHSTQLRVSLKISEYFKDFTLFKKIVINNCSTNANK